MRPSFHHSTHHRQHARPLSYFPYCAFSPTLLHPSTSSNKEQFWREPLHMIFLFFQERLRNELRKVAVLVARLFESRVQVLLQILPQRVAAWSQNHGALDWSVVCQLSSCYYILEPTGWAGRAVVFSVTTRWGTCLGRASRFLSRMGLLTSGIRLCLGAKAHVLVAVAGISNIQCM